MDSEGRFIEMSPKLFAWSLSLATLLAIAGVLALASPAPLRADSDPWTKAQTVQPADLGKELGNPKTAPTSSTRARAFLTTCAPAPKPSSSTQACVT